MLIINLNIILRHIVDSNLLIPINIRVPKHIGDRLDDLRSKTFSSRYHWILNAIDEKISNEEMAEKTKKEEK